MSKRDAIQQAINRASLRLLQSEDVAKACMAAEAHPKLTEVLMTMHHQIAQIDKDLSGLRANMLQLAQVIDRGASVTAFTHVLLEKMAARLNIDPSSLIEAEEAGNEGG